MVANGLKLSIIIATYQPGDGFDRVMDSLDAQTLPQEEFEVIVIDDGSPDNTFERLKEFAAQRSNMSVHRIENSGWPSKPRNIGISMARGEWVFFMDHDDSLFPDGLRRAAEYASETNADLLSVKESKTSDAWWGMYALRSGNIANALQSYGIDRVLPMVPHKFYRREFLLAHEIHFPEGRRQLWEDIYVNIEAWRHARVVAILADTPVYLWHSSKTNNSKSYGPLDPEFWDRLDDLLAFASRTLDQPDYGEALRVIVLQQWRSRILTRLSQSLLTASEADGIVAVARARDIGQRFVPLEWDQGLGKYEQARAVLLRAGRADLLAALRVIDSNTKLDAHTTSCFWRGGKLHLELEARLVDKQNNPIRLVRRDGRLFRELPARINMALPTDVTDLTDTLAGIDLDLAVRDRNADITWAIDIEISHSWVETAGGAHPSLHAVAVVDFDVLALGKPLPDHLYDIVARYRWSGAARASALRYESVAQPALIRGRQAVAYSTTRATLAVDLSGELRNVIADGGLVARQALGTSSNLTLPLPKLALFEAQDRPVRMRVESLNGKKDLVLDGILVAGPGGALVHVSSEELIVDGRYRIAFAVDGADSFVGGGRLIKVRAGRVMLVGRPSPIHSRMMQRMKLAAIRILGR